MRATPIVLELRDALAAYEKLEASFCHHVRSSEDATIRPSPHSPVRPPAHALDDGNGRRAWELRSALEERATVLGDLARRALAEVMLPDRPARTVRLLGLALESRVDLRVLAARDWIDPWPGGRDLERTIADPRPAKSPGRFVPVRDSSHAADLRRAVEAALDAEVDVAAWLAHVLRRTMRDRLSTPDVLLDGRPITPEASALHLLASADAPRAPGAARPPRPEIPAALAGQPHTDEAVQAVSTALVQEYDVAGWLAHQLRAVLAARDVTAASLVRTNTGAPHATAFLRLLSTTDG